VDRTDDVVTQTLYSRMDSLLKEEKHNIAWLKKALNWAVELEFTTIPAYLYALWSVKDGTCEVAKMVRGIVMEEMLHMALACNMITAIGAAPDILKSAPTYPKKLPANIQKEISVALVGVSPKANDPNDVVKAFMAIEASEKPLARAEDSFPTIGKLYEAIRKALHDPANKKDFGESGKQVVRDFGVKSEYKVVDLTSDGAIDLKEVDKAIQLITEQGEGSTTSPDSNTGLAHYYRFGEIYHGRRLKKHGVGTEKVTWKFDGEALARPAVHALGVVPRGGWARPRMEPDIKDLLDGFNAMYRELVGKLHNAWRESGDFSLVEAFAIMNKLEECADKIITHELPDFEGQPGKHYGPEFLPPVA
jgi:rubrerythrin